MSCAGLDHAALVGLGKAVKNLVILFPLGDYYFIFFVLTAA